MRITARLLCLFFVLVQFAHGQDYYYYRSAYLSWKTNPSANNTIDFTLTLSLETIYFQEVPLVIETGLSVLVSDSQFYFDSNDLTKVATPNLTITLVNEQEDYFTGVWTVSHTYPSSVTSYIAYFLLSGRRSSTSNNFPTSDAKVSTKINVNPTKSQSSPVSSVLPILEVMVSTQTHIQIVAADPDGESVTFSLATGTQMGDSSQTQPPGVSIDHSSGALSITSAINFGFNTVQVLITDSSGNYIALDFIINAYIVNYYCTSTACPDETCLSSSDCNCGGSCQLPAPLIITTTNLTPPEQNAQLNYRVGDNIVLNFVVDDLNFAGPVYIFGLGGPLSSSFSTQVDCNSDSGCTCTGCNNPQLVTFHWIPQLSDLQTAYVICVGARSVDEELSTCQYCVSIDVNATAPITSTTTTTTLTTTTSTSTTSSTTSTTGDGFGTTTTGDSTTTTTTTGSSSPPRSHTYREIYGNNVTEHYVDFSTASNYSLTSNKSHSSGYGISWTPKTRDDTIYFHCNRCIDLVHVVTGVHFWINGGTTGGQNITFSLLGYINQSKTIQPAFEVNVNDFLTTGSIPHYWTKANINLTSLITVPQRYNGILFRNGLDTPQETLYLDDIGFWYNTPNLTKSN